MGRQAIYALLEGGLGVIVSLVGVTALGSRTSARALAILAAFAFCGGLAVAYAWEYTRPVTSDTDTLGLRPAIVLISAGLNATTALCAGWTLRAAIRRARSSK
jgi:hypothetical protein